MADDLFTPITEQNKEMFKTYLSLNEKFLKLFGKVHDAHQACNRAEDYRLQLLNRGLDTNSVNFEAIKIDENLMKYYLEFMNKYLERISNELNKLYQIFLGKKTYKTFHEQENTIMGLFDIVSHAESRCMKRRGIFVSRCLNALNSAKETDYYKMLLG